MSQLRFIPATFAASAALLFTSLASAVAAPPTDPSSTCSVNADCGRGYECTVVGESGCASSACPPGASCPAPEPCTVTETKSCTPAHCKVTADCADGMVCHEWTEPCAVTNCACAPGEKCDCGTTTCDPTTISMCTPPYLLPCTAAADCGAGFTCEQEQSCNCATSGGGATPPTPSSGASPNIPAGGAPPDDQADPVPTPVPSPCTCGLSGEFQCVAKDIACTTASDCPTGWSCDQEVAPSLPEPACNGKDCPPAATPAPVTSSCRPPYYSGGSVGSTGSGTATSGGGVVFPGVPTASGGSASTSGSAGTTSAPESKAADDGQSHESAACQFGRAPLSSGAFSLLAVLGALLGLKRRRAQG